ncbi:TPA: hypothetical protein MAO83_002423 [Klebsiella pneumoniae]|uniref:hypothetical protein n=1 Tax=Klebsiella pneumoniae TaxID=573 RepID=UPI001CBC297C|nr:hypothetical protein [Klebsiella pneumoniae]EKJ7591918.1 hypothetical protein [Klebsiella pneumoniae]MBZ1674586.1 hypothetical protein [Klebsiella pneumoniae]MEB5985018.1 hypothetical protein [Klebsiella pneumoniae]HBR3491811.1 hypothetical protein [Klebsiella pneumoniae]HBS7166519.1 hypothetical protein [Klebsiella pneumoniae]
MTDITELAQSKSLRKKLNRRLNDAYGFQRTSGGKHTTISLSIDECKSIIADMDERLSLVEALDKAQQVDEELCKLLPPGVEYMDPPDGGDVTPLEGVRRMVADYRQRIAELESRTVKLPQRLQPGADGYDDWYVHSDDDGEYLKFDDVLAMLTAAGIKVEAE